MYHVCYAIYFFPYNFVIKLYFSQRNVLTACVASGVRVQLLGISFFRVSSFDSLRHYYLMSPATSLVLVVPSDGTTKTNDVAGNLGRHIVFASTANQIL